MALVTNKKAIDHSTASLTVVTYCAN